MQYKYIGNGIGVPGLPHEITREEAHELGVETILDAAIANGNYVETPLSPNTTTSPQIEERDLGGKKRSLNNG